ncbi:MAG: cytochrome c, partial [Fimbriimonadales bacterium]
DPELVKQGELIYNKQACGTCHMNPKSVIKAPDLNGLYMSQVTLTDGTTLTADEEYLRTAIVEPGKHIVKGYQNMMPPYKQLSEKELDALVAYLISLK